MTPRAHAARPARATPDVTVVVPTRDRRPLLLRTLGTVRAQTGVDLEVIVVDDGSADGSADAVRGLDDHRIRVVRHHRPRGVAVARNAGLARARAPWVAFLDDDDVWAPDKLLAQLSEAASHDGVGWVCAGAVITDPSLRIVTGQRPPSPDAIERIPCSNVVPGGGSGTIVRTELLRRLGGFDARLSNMADWDLWVRLWLAAPVAVVRRPLVGYVRHPSTLSGDLTGVLAEFELIRAKYAVERQARGLPDSTGTLEWFVHRQVEAGRRLTAARAYVSFGRTYRFRRYRRWAFGALMAPKRLSRRRDRKAQRQLPPSWLEEAEAWLVPLRSPEVAPPAACDSGVIPSGSDPRREPSDWRGRTAV